MDASTIVAVIIGIGFAALVVAVAVRMSKKKIPRAESRQVSDQSPAEAQGADTAGGKAKTQVKVPTQGKPAPVKGLRPLEESSLRGKLDEDEKPKEEKTPEPAEPLKFKFELNARRGLGEGLERTRKEGFIARLLEVFSGPKEINEELVSRAEETLLSADLGVATAMELLEQIKTEFHPVEGDLGPQILEFLKARVQAMIGGLPNGPAKLDAVEGPAVIMVVGVNGTGKTTTIGKMANLYASQGKKVLLVAGDTYRAAGMEQLNIWGGRIGVPVVMGKTGQDPASLMFDAARRAKDENFDLLIADTAGRLHTDTNLVEELKKIHRTIGKALPGAPHEVMLLLDATMGQNAVRQADVFLKAVDVSGITLAKLDGTAKGGVVISIAREMKLPIRFVGVGEAVDDLRPFDADEFVNALFQS